MSPHVQAWFTLPASRATAPGSTRRGRLQPGEFVLEIQRLGSAVGPSLAVGRTFRARLDPEIGQKIRQWLECAGPFDPEAVTLPPGDVLVRIDEEHCST